MTEDFTLGGDKLWLTCKPCAHTWIAAYLPMEMSKVGKLLKGARCPKCGDKAIFMATAADVKAAQEKTA